MCLVVRARVRPSTSAQAPARKHILVAGISQQGLYLKHVRAKNLCETLCLTATSRTSVHRFVANSKKGRLNLPPTTIRNR